MDSGLLPTIDQTLLLRCCLLPAGAARRALDAWLARHDDPAEALRREHRETHRAMVPLLASAVAAQGLAVPPELLDVLREALMDEDRRTRELAEILLEVLIELEGEGIDPILVDGLALAQGVYRAHAARHTGHVRLLLPDGTSPRALEAAFERTGLAHETGAAGQVEGVTWIHPSGARVAASRHLFHARFYPVPNPALFESSERISIGGRSIRMLGPNDALLSACARYAGANTVSWACDSCLLIAARPDLSWNDFRARALAGRLALRVAAPLRYLAAELGAPIPEAVLEALEEAAQAAGRAEREAALHELRTLRDGGLTGVLRAVEARGTRLEILRLAMLPSREFLREAHGIAGAGAVASFHARRAFKLLRRTTPWPAHALPVIGQAKPRR